MQPLLDVHIHLRGGEAQGSNDPIAYHTIALGSCRLAQRRVHVALTRVFSTPYWRLRRQTVRVVHQHVNVSDGAQAVVAGEMNTGQPTGGRARGRRQGNRIWGNTVLRDL